MTTRYTAAQAREASDLLWDCWQAGRRVAHLPEAMRPGTRADGYVVQARLAARGAGPLYGWKIAATSAAGQAHINVDGPLAGRLLRERAFESGAELPFGANHMRVAEAEFAFRLGRDLPPRDQPYDVGDVLDAVATLHPAIEVPDSRFDDFTLVGGPSLIADNACAHLFVLGPAAPDRWRALDLVHHAVTGTVAPGAGGCGTPGTPLVHHGRGANVLGDPRTALTWLVNELASLGLTLRAGEVVTTGTCIVPLPIAPGVHVRADFGELGYAKATIL